MIPIVFTSVREQNSKIKTSDGSQTFRTAGRLSKEAAMYSDDLWNYSVLLFFPYRRAIAYTRDVIYARAYVTDEVITASARYGTNKH
jgi:hypothetical protein